MGWQETVFEREPLYKEVWAEPVSTVAERYALSNVGEDLSKARCTDAAARILGASGSRTDSPSDTASQRPQRSHRSHSPGACRRSGS